MLESTFTVAQMIVDNRIADQSEIKNFQNFIEQWSSRKVNLLQNATQLNEYQIQWYNLLPKFPKKQVVSRLDEYTKGAFSVLQTKVYELVADQYEAFETKSTEMIRVAKETGNTDISLEILFDRFVQPPRYLKAYDFSTLLTYLKSK